VAKERWQVAAAVDNAYKHDPARLLTVEEDVLSDREGEEARPQILSAASAHTWSFSKLSRFGSQAFNEASGGFRFVFGNM
jgi:hypothetical protein